MTVDLPRRLAALVIAIAFIGAPAAAQAPRDVPRAYWAYDAVENLAARGLIKGYPPSGRFFGARTVTRYEMATLIQRVLGRIDELAEKRTDPGPTEVVNAQQLDEIRKLTDEFRTELLVIGANVRKAQEEIAVLHGRVDEAERSAARAASDAASARHAAGVARADTDILKRDFGSLKTALAATSKELSTIAREQRTHKIGGYLQPRFEALEGGGSSLFNPAGSGGTGQTPSFGGPAAGGPRYGFLVRRARLRVTGPVGQRSDYQLQLDAQSVGGVSLIDAFVNLSDVPARGLIARLGQHSPLFGFELPLSGTLRESPERAFGFGTGAGDYPIFKTTVSAAGGVVTPGSVVPLFAGQNRDVGAAAIWTSRGPIESRSRLSLSVINGEGRASSGVRNTNQNLDLLGRAETNLLDGKLGLGLSGYYGSLSARSGPPTGGVPVAFSQAYRYLGGVDLRYLTPWGTSLRAEYVGGLYEVTPDRGQYLQGNHAQAWYVVARHPLSKKLEVVAKYDQFEPITQLGKFAAGLGRRDLIRQTLGGGLMYQLDDATRFRLWYARGLTPYDPSVISGAGRARLGLVTGEVQVVF